jgi:hypothetical protein
MGPRGEQTSADQSSGRRDVAGTPFGPGTVLARRFSLDDLLGEFDGARFWRATDQTLARSVAVHVLPTSDPRAGSLLTAARTSALVTDGHLLRVLDAAEEDGVVYVVNEWGSGVSFDRLLAEGPLSPRRAAWVVKEVAEAIVTAHRNGVAHGRLLPENVMISEAGSVKVIGFVIDAVLRSDAGRGQRRVTGGEEMNAHESDVVNLAGLLYAAPVGRWPGSEGSSIPDAPSEHGRPLRPRQVRAGVPRPLDAICERVLNAEAHPHMLPIESAHEIYAALSDYIGDPGTAVGGQVAGPGTEPTTRLDRGDLPGAALGPTAGAAAGAAVGGTGRDTGTDDDPGSVEDTSDLPVTGELSQPGWNGNAPGPVDPDPSDFDPEATQAGTPMFFDEAPGGWLPGAGDGHGDGRSRAAASRPPAPPEPPERPLFADGPSAAAAAAARAQDPTSRSWAATGDDDSFLGSFRGTTSPRAASRTGDGTSSGYPAVPASWGPDADEPPPADPESWDDDHEDVPGRSWLRLAVVLAVVLLLVLGVVLAFNLGRGPGGDPGANPSPTRAPSSAAPASVKLPISGVTDFDPQGDPPEENPDLAPLAVDGKPGTAWQTLTYRGNPQLGGLKSGVGLLVDLGKPVKVGEVKLTLLGTGTSLDLLAAPDDTEVAPTSTDGLDTVASAEDAGTTVDLKPKKSVTTRWVVVWLTSLPAAPGGFKGQVAEISVRS